MVKKKETNLLSLRVFNPEQKAYKDKEGLQFILHYRTQEREIIGLQIESSVSYQEPDRVPD